MRTIRVFRVYAMSQTENSNSLCLNLKQAQNLHTYFSERINQGSHINTVSDATLNNLFAKSFAFDNDYDEFTSHLSGCDYCFQIENVDIKGLVNTVVDNDITNTGPYIYVNMYSELIESSSVNSMIPTIENFLTRFWVIMESEFALSHVLYPRKESIHFWSTLCNSALTNKPDSNEQITVLSDGRLNYMEMYTQKYAYIFLDSSKATDKLDKAEEIVSRKNDDENKLSVIKELVKGLSERIVLLILSVAFFDKANVNALPDPLVTAMSLLHLESQHSDSEDFEDATSFSMDMWKGIVVEITKSHPDMFDVIMQIDKNT